MHQFTLAKHTLAVRSLKNPAHTPHLWLETLYALLRTRRRHLSMYVYYICTWRRRHINGAIASRERGALTPSMRRRRHVLGHDVQEAVCTRMTHCFPRGSSCVPYTYALVYFIYLFPTATRGAVRVYVM